MGESGASLADLKDGTSAPRVAGVRSQRLIARRARAALKQELDARGTLGSVRARLRADVFHALTNEVWARGRRRPKWGRHTARRQPPGFQAA